MQSITLSWSPAPCPVGPSSRRAFAGIGFSRRLCVWVLLLLPSLAFWGSRQAKLPFE